MALARLGRGFMHACLVLLLSMHQREFVVTPGGPLIVVAAAAVRSDREHGRGAGIAWSTSAAGGDQTRSRGRRLLDVCHTKRCVEDIPVCPRCSSSADVDAAVSHCREHGHVFECHRHPVTGALHFEPPARSYTDPATQPGGK